MKHPFYQTIDERITSIQQQGLYKQEHIFISPQSAHITLASGKKVINLCANNYLGLANHPRLCEVASKSVYRYGFGLASVRFICGTQSIHIELEEKIADFLKTESAILFSSCFDANGALFEALLEQDDAIFSDSLNHASIIDGIRLCKAARYRFQHNTMEELESSLKNSSERYKMIATDGVFSMDGEIANLPSIVRLAKQYNALIMVDDCHATGILGKEGRGSHEHHHVMGKIDLLTGTLGKALGGASGGYIAGKKNVIEYLRQKARPYLFSNTLVPSLAATALEVFSLLEQEGEGLRKQLWENTRYFSQHLQALGFTIAGGEHPILPVMIGDANLTVQFARQMLEEGIFVIGFSYPVVPLGTARIRTQMSALHSKHDLDHALGAFEKVGRALKVI